MILEGIVTTLDAAGDCNIAPMGPRVDPHMERFVLRPFNTAQTYRNLKAHGEGVLHVTDDVLLLAKAALGPVEPAGGMFRAEHVSGWVLANACRYYEFRVKSLDDRSERVTIECATVHAVRLRDFFGFNRAKHAVVEAAILATRTDFLPLAEIEADFKKLAVIVDKTGGPQEREAFDYLQKHVTAVASSQAAAKAAQP